jgi:hypothetical protein
MEETMAVLTALNRRVIVSWFVIAVFAATVGCAGESPKPMQQPSPEQVKGSADRSFDKLKQEERERRPGAQ